MDGPPTDDKAAISFGMCKPCSEKVMQEWQETMEGRIVETKPAAKFQIVTSYYLDQKPGDERMKVSNRFKYNERGGIEEALAFFEKQQQAPGVEAVFLFTAEWKLIFAEPGLDNTEGFTIRGAVL